MKQIIESLKTGRTNIENVPAPVVKKGCVLIQTTHSLVSLGTERMLVRFGNANLLQKARQQPEKVKQAWEKVRSDGFMPTLDAVRKKLEQPLPLGYCNVGKVISVGESVDGFHVGDRVASNGNHAEFVCVPRNLVAHIPDNVSNEEATFTVVGAIALQGLRLCNPVLGETIVVIGLGLIGLITAQLLAANGCRVIGIDPDERKIVIAKAMNIDAVNPSSGIDPIKYINDQTNGYGADAVLIAASSSSNSIISQAAMMSRKKGRIVLIGVVGLDINRSDFYEKELEFKVSCSYGPGRYDDNYEQKGIDYPLPYVRWTENRNFEAILYALSSGKLQVKQLITERVAIDDFYKIYKSIDNSNSKSIASILIYNEHSSRDNVVTVSPNFFLKREGLIGVIGSGNFAKMTMLPALKEAGARIKYISSLGGLTATNLAKKYGIEKSTTDYSIILRDEKVSLVLIATRHDQHASLVTESLKAGKNVFVEKPLALNDQELGDVLASYRPNTLVTVGFNRRFSPHSEKVKRLLGKALMNVVATMNAGYIPADAWVHDVEIGGGRIVGEACHFIDLITYFTGSRVKKVFMNAMGESPKQNTDNASILLKYENGSTGVVNYFSNGSRAYSKERIEVYSQGKTAIIDNFRITKAYGFDGFSRLKTKQDKGHKAQFKLLVDRVENGGQPLIPFDEIVNTTRASFAAVESLKTGGWVNVD